MTGNEAQLRKAVALRYEAGNDAAPHVVAKGAGPLADRIIELAREHGVPVQEDRDLTALLSQLDVNVRIPPELYRAVAEIIAFVYRLSARD
jgi:flagellar biosynthesis protein